MTILSRILFDFVLLLLILSNEFLESNTTFTSLAPLCTGTRFSFYLFGFEDFTNVGNLVRQLSNEAKLFSMVSDSS